MQGQGTGENRGVSVDVGDVGCDSGGSSDIVEGQFADFLVQFQEKRQWLANSAYLPKISSFRPSCISKAQKTQGSRRRISIGQQMDSREGEREDTGCAENSDFCLRRTSCREASRTKKR